MQPANRYTLTAISLHWIIALLIGVNVLLALSVDYLPDAMTRPVIDFHKSTGIIIILLVAVRIAWRITHKPPALPAIYNKWESRGAHAAHLGLYFLIVALPLSGWIHNSAWSAASSHPFMLFWIIPWFNLGFVTMLDPATKEMVHGLFGTIHTYLGYALYGVLAAHILGALKHQLIDKHPELQRMWR